VLCSDADTEDSGNECIGQEPLANDNHCEAVCYVVGKNKPHQPQLDYASLSKICHAILVYFLQMVKTMFDT